MLQTEEPLVDYLIIQHIANQCSVYFASHGIDCKVDCNLSKSTVKCLQKLDKLQPHQFAQVFNSAKKKDPDILSYDKPMRNYGNFKDWLTAVLKEKLKEKECGSDVLNQKPVTNKLYLALGCFNTRAMQQVK